MLTIVVVVLAMSAGPAMASVCAGADCGPAMVCDRAFTPDCPMVSGAFMSHGDCEHPAERGAIVGLSHQAGPEFGLAGAALPGVVTPPAAIMSVSASPLADARGAPHLTSVIRI
jgi:hypothetical protein